ncbi:MAG TPA: MFS transporter [Ramlibacter sp.]|jgi:fucose permease
MSAIDMSVAPARTNIIVLTYAVALLHGLTLVSFPAVSAVLTGELGLSNSQYGAIFLPQVGFAVLGSLFGGFLTQRLGLKALLLAALLACAASQAALVTTAFVAPDARFITVLAGTAMLGLGFGLGGAPLNALPGLLFPSRRDSALVALHTLLGLGLALGPLVAAGFVRAGAWTGFPQSLLVLCSILFLLISISAFPAREPASASSGGETPLRTPGFWGLVGIAVLYAFAEGTFSNWIVIFLTEAKRLPMTTGTAALSAFWAALVAGRLVVSLLALRLPPQPIWRALPLLMIAAFLALPYADSAVSGIALFAAAGLACSAFFPLTIAVASQRFPTQVPWVSSMMIAALMVGVGLGSFATGALRELLPLEQLYRLSIVYPVSALVLILLLDGRRVEVNRR